jgi:nucleotide-binding universal stress UspA family protein
MKKILIPTDFSKVTEGALKAATEIARKTHAEVELLHIVEAPFEMKFTAAGVPLMPDGMNDIFILKSIESAKGLMKKILDDAQYAGVKFLPRIKVGDPYTHFTKHIVKEPADLIIMGTEGTHSFLKGFFSSSNAEKIVTHANCMVLSVKKILHNFRIRNVVFATNFEDDSPAFLEKLKDLQNIFDFKIHLLYINALVSHISDTARIEKLKREFIRKHGICNYEFHLLEDMTEYTGITAYADKINADIIALSTHQHSGLHWLGGISEDLVNYAEQPILTYKTE